MTTLPGDNIPSDVIAVLAAFAPVDMPQWICPSGYAPLFTGCTFAEGPPGSWSVVLPCYPKPRLPIGLLHF